MDIGTHWAPRLDTSGPQADKQTVLGHLWGGSGAGLEKYIEIYLIPDALQPSGLSSLSRDSSIFTISP